MNPVTIRTLYAGNLRTEATHVASNTILLTDAPLDNNGRGESFSPTDLVCAALGSCMMTLMGILAQREGIDLEGTQIQITKYMEASPRRIGKIVVVFEVKSASPLDVQQQEKLRRAALTCPVTLSLHPDIQQEVSFNFELQSAGPVL